MSHSQGLGSSSGRERESRHLWVGGLPDDIDEAGIKDYFSKFGKIEGVKILPQKYPNIGVAAFIDYFDVKSATEAKETKHKLNGQELRTNFKANPGDKHDHVGSRSHDSKEKQQDKRESESSSSGSESGSSSSSTSTDSDQDTKIAKKNRKKASSGGLFIKAAGLANRPDRVLQDGLFYEFSRYSNSVTIRLYGDSEKKWALIKYKRADKCKEAFAQSQGMILFGSKLKLTQMELEGFPPGSLDQRGGGGEPGPQFMMEDLDPLATRSLFVGNIPKHISVYELRDAFLRYGNVLDVEIKKMGGSATYGFILYYDLMSAVTAKQYMDGHNLKGNSIRVGFGKGTASKQLWIDGIDPTMAESQLERQLNKYGRIIRLGIDRHRCCAMVQYDNVDSAKEALSSVKGTFIKNSRRLMTDFANRDARAAFFNHMDAGGEPGLPPPRGFPGPPGPMYGAEMVGDPRMMMPPRPGGMHMLGRGGGFPPHGGHPMDYYYNPYMEEYYGGRPPYGPPGMRRFPPGPGRGFGREGPDDYDEELRAFSRKREREKRRRQTTSSESPDSGSEENEDGDSHRKRKSGKGKDKGKKSVKKSKKDLSDEGETGSDSEDHREESRLKATKKSRDLREKLRKISRRKKKDASSEAESSDEEEIQKPDKSKNKAEKVLDEKSPPQSSQRKVYKTSPPSREPSLSKEEVRKPSRTKVKSEQKTTRPDGSPTRSVKRKVRRNSRSPSLPSPQTPPSRSDISSKQKPERDGKLSEEGSDAETKSRKQSKESKNEKAKEYMDRSPASDVKKGRDSREEASNGAAAVPAKEEEEDDGFHEMKDPRIREKHSKPVETPQSPIMSTKSSRSSIHGNIESELSSGEDFKLEATDWSSSRGKPSHRQKQMSSDKEKGGVQQRQERQEDGDHDVEKFPSSSLPHSPRPRTPEYPVEELEWKEGVPHTPPSEEEEEDRGSSKGRASRKPSRKLPRRYQIESATEQGTGRREGARHREGGKDGRQERRHHAQPPSPSPPPQSYSTHQRKRHHHSPPPPAEGFDRRKRRGRAYSPGSGAGGGGYQQRRRHSRSPPYPGSPPPPLYRAKSPYGGSPPHGRPRSPIPRARAPRRRYDSPPFEGQRGKYSRGHASPPSPHHRYPFSPTPPPPRTTARSPQGRRYGRRRSSSLSPPRGGRGTRRERSPPSDHVRASPRVSDERYEPVKRPGKHVYSRSPSPKDKYREVKDDYSDSKRRRVAVSRPKSPSSTPPPAMREEKNDMSSLKSARQQAHQQDSIQSGSDQRSFKQTSSSTTASAQHGSHRQSFSTDGSTNQASVPKSQAPPITPPENNLLDLLRRYPVMWQGMLMLKNDSAAVQLHFLSGNAQLAKSSLPQQTDQPMPVLRISQRMRLEKTQLEGVDRRIQTDGEHCLLLALPCGRDANDVHNQTHALKNNLINYLLQKQAAGIINVPATQGGGYVLHIFPPCVFSQSHLSRVAPDLLSNASVNCHLMIVVATM